jgi:hypothetical protein
MLTPDEAFAPLNVTSATSRAPDDEWRPMLLVPMDAPQLSMGIINRFCPEGYAFTTGWRYLNAAGQLLGCVVRCDRPANGLPAAKQVKPFTFCEGPDGKPEWRCKGFNEPRPLYGLDRLAARPDAPVLGGGRREDRRCSDDAFQRLRGGYVARWFKRCPKG